MSNRLLVVLVLWAALSASFPAVASSETNRFRVRNKQDLVKAAERARPGSDVVLLPGVYEGEILLSGLRGTPEAPIRIRAAIPDNPPVIQGGKYGIRLSAVAHVTLEHLTIENPATCGLMVDGSTSPDQVAVGLLLEKLTLRLGGRRAVGIRVNGAKDCRIQRVRIEKWSDSVAIQLVDSERVNLRDCWLDGAGLGTVGVSIAGQGRYTVIQGCRFSGITGHGVEFAGSDCSNLPDTGGEASVFVRNNEFCRVGSVAAYRGRCSSGILENNSIYRPARSILRFLANPEEDAPASSPLRRFSENVVVWQSGELQGFAEQEKEVELNPQELELSRNYWYCTTASVFSRLATDPFVESDGTYGEDPKYHDPENCDLRMLRTRQHLRASRASQATWLPAVTGFIIKHQLLFLISAAVLVLAGLCFLAWRGYFTADSGPRATLRRAKLVAADNGVDDAPVFPHETIPSLSRAELSDYFGHLALVMAGLFLYGSFIPFNYQRIEWEVAKDRFRQIPYLNLGLENLADWMANLLLVLPIAYCATVAMLGERLARWQRWGRAAVIGLLCLGFCVGVEFLQLWFPGRTVSQNDLLAEGLGAGIGCLLAVWTADAVQDKVYAALTATSPRQILTFGLTVYTLGYVLYQVLPLDVSFSSDTLWTRWEQGKISLWGMQDETTSWGHWQAWLDQGVLSLPVGVYLWMHRGKRPPGTGMMLARCLLLAGLIELAQVFIYSRHASLASGLVATSGFFVGGLLAPQIFRQFDTWWTVAAAKRRLLLTSGLTLVYLVLLVGRIVRPWELRLSEPGIDRLSTYWRIPFASLYSGSDFHAFVSIAQSVAVFLPAGCLLADLTVAARSRLPGTVQDLLVSAGLGILASTLELAQAWRPDSVLDVTATLCYLLGGLSGLLLHRALMTAGHQRNSPASWKGWEPPPKRRAPVWVCTLVALSMVFVMGWVVPEWLRWYTAEPLVPVQYS